MDAVVALALAVGCAVALGSMGVTSIDRALSALAQFVGGWHGDGWPRGIQEEDPDRPWGSPAPRAARRRESIVLEAPKPTLNAVRPVVRQR